MIWKQKLNQDVPPQTRSEMKTFHSYCRSISCFIIRLRIKTATSEKHDIHGLNFLCFFFLFCLNPYLQHTPSGPQVPDATARVFFPPSDQTIWPPLDWSLTQGKLFLVWFVLHRHHKLLRRFTQTEISDKHASGKNFYTCGKI